jgi:tRNA-5-taurinomethyluridine 2-sulfurtransferase
MKIAVLISGGVDSSVALRLLKDQGHELHAFYLKIWLEDDIQFLGDCPWEEDLQYVREICEEVDVPLEIMPMQKEYFDTVVDYTISEVKAGRTPNPDIMCNNMVKFGLFLDKIDDTFEKVASGHYAQTEEQDGCHFLKRAPDPVKDQTYFLGRLSQDQLARIVFPIGHLDKAEVRQLAEKYDLPNQKRKDSQGICFLGKFKYSEFLRSYLGEKPGNILEYETGEKIGEHEGFWYHTIGQRRGMKLSGGPWFVVAKDSEKNIVYISKNYHSEDKKRDELEVGEFNWFAGSAQLAKDASTANNLQVKLRHGEQMYNCQITFEPDDKTAKIKLDQDDQGIAPGQFAVFYQDDLCLGSAVILK